MAKYTKRSNTASDLVVLVTGDLGDFSKGDKLTKDMDIAEYFRLQMQEANDDWSATDDAIMAVVRSVPMLDDAEDWEVSVCEALEKSNSVQGTQENVIGRGVADALPDQRKPQDVDLAPGRFGVLLDENEAMRTALHAAAMAPIDNMEAPSKVLLASVEFAGITIDNRGFPSDWKSTFDGRPVPGSTPGEAYLKATGNKVLTEHTYTFAEYKVKPKGSTQLIAYDYWKSAVDQTKEAKAFADTINEVKLAMPGAKSKEAAKGKYASLRWSGRQNVKRRNEAGLNGMYRGMKKAVSAWFMMRDIATDPVLSKNIGVSFNVLKPGKDNVVGLVTPIRIWDKNVENGPDKAYTVSAFSNLDLDKCREEGGTFADLVDSTRTGEQQNDIEGAKPLTAETVKTALTDLAAYFMVRANVVDLISAGNSKPGKGEEDELGFTPEANDIVLNIVNIVRSAVKASNDWEKNGRFDNITELRDKQHTALNAEALKAYGT